MKLAVQEQYLPGDTMAEKWRVAQNWGFDGIELRGRDGYELRNRLPHLREARAQGAVFPTVCVEMDHFLGDFDPAKRRNALDQLRSQLDIVAELGGYGAVTPASWGLFSRRLPPFIPPRSEEDDHSALLEGFGELGRHAASLGVELLIEPLNRYEDYLVNTIATAASIGDELRLDSIGVCADSYHMNIEEADVAASLRDNRARLRHVQLSDSNRLEPGQGHFDWALFFRTLDELSYDRFYAWECRLSGPPEVALPASVAFVRSFS